jgi:hypothetical protein
VEAQRTHALGFLLSAGYVRWTAARDLVGARDTLLGARLTLRLEL